ncbi:MAG: tetratricopeptide repeat protein [Pseudomonadota bacterium]
MGNTTGAKRVGNISDIKGATSDLVAIISGMATAYNEGLRKYERSISEKEVPAWVLNNLASFFYTVGYFSSASPLFRQTLALREKSYQKSIRISLYQ